MNKRVNKKWIHGFGMVGVILAVMYFSGAGVTWAQIDEVQQGGQELFRQHCAVCHGTNAKGMGPLTSDLIGIPANLTELAKRNGGTFPFWRTYRIIDGREQVAQHGVREMPVWGNWFQIPEDEGHGATDWRDQVRGRIWQLLVYLKSIQEPS
jgi:mono/diheme cytochrome c family protein